MLLIAARINKKCYISFSFPTLSKHLGRVVDVLYCNSVPFLLDTWLQLLESLLFYFALHNTPLFFIRGTGLDCSPASVLILKTTLLYGSRLWLVIVLLELAETSLKKTEWWHMIFKNLLYLSTFSLPHDCADIHGFQKYLADRWSRAFSVGFHSSVRAETSPDSLTF